METRNFFIAELDDCFEAKNVICDFVDVHGEYEIRDKFTVWEDIYIRYFARHYTSTGSVTSLCGLLSILTGKRWDYYHLLGGDNDTWQDMFYVMEDWTEGKLRAFQSVYFGDVFSVDVYIPDIFGETTKVSASCPAETVKELEKIFEVEIELEEEYE